MKKIKDLLKKIIKKIQLKLCSMDKHRPVILNGDARPQCQSCGKVLV